MSIQLNNSLIKVYRNEDDTYFTFLSGNEYDTETKTAGRKFYSKRKIKFLGGQEVKNKSKIKVIDGFISPYKYRVKNEKNIYSYVTGEVFYIKEFQLVEDGVREKQKLFNGFNQPQRQYMNRQVNKQAEKLNPFSFNEYGDVTPF